MQFHVLKDLLPFVEGPSRYLGSEINSIHKNSEKLCLSIALAFPDLYEIGMSHFGLQILYHILNSHDQIWAQRVFAPGLDMAQRMKKTGVPLCSLESDTPLSEFDIIGFSLLYELNFTNVLLMLDLAGIPFRASDRNETHPIIIAGGPCTVNPETVADFFDAMVIGDGELVVMEIARVFMEWKASGSRDKTDLLKRWSVIEGVYIPSFFSVAYDESGRQLIHPNFDNYKNVSRAIVPDLEKASFPDKPVVAYGRPVHDRLRLELARGCTRGCRFCQAGMIYRPVRERSLAHLLDLAEKSLAATGYEDISLLSLSTGDYSCLTPLMQQLFSRYADDLVAISLPSFRAGTLTPELMDMIRQIRKTGFTIAPEAGSARLRAVINKNITEAEILETVSNAFQLGWKVFKLYFMLGLPTETHDDICAISDLVNRIKNIKGKGGRPADIHVSVSTFIPKSHTPFQWEPQLSLAKSKDKIEELRQRLKIRGVHFKWQKPETSVLEGLFARGDRRLSYLLESAYYKGCVFDGWSDSFRFDLWDAACREIGIDADYYTTRKREFDEPLPWDHIDTRVSKDFLQSEYQKAIEVESTPDCRDGQCQGCGVCDFEKIMPGTQLNNKIQTASLPLRPPDKEISEDIKINVAYEKKRSAKYFGHLELANIFFRAIRRAKIPVKFSKGFHPKPKISFHDALPVGLESAKEVFKMTLTGKMDCDVIARKLNAQLPDGVAVLDCEISDSRHFLNKSDSVFYSVVLPEGDFDQNLIRKYNDADEWILFRQSHKGGIKEINLKDIVPCIEFKAHNEIRMKICVVAGKGVRPWEVMKSVFDFSDDWARRAHIIKLNE
jgi:radical SAM family uncharacterized protein/radical SAM-linked protein